MHSIIHTFDHGQMTMFDAEIVVNTPLILTQANILLVLICIDHVFYPIVQSWLLSS